MVIDTSAIIAVLEKEPEARAFAEAILADRNRTMSAVSLLEAGIVVEARRGEYGGLELDLLVQKTGMEIVAFSAEQASIARSAWRKFGKGRHPAGLNLGDCCSYALSMVTGEPLLFKGDDFEKTDVAPAMPKTRQ